MARQGEPFDEIMIVNPTDHQSVHHGGKHMMFYPVVAPTLSGYFGEGPDQMGYFAEDFAELPELAEFYEAPELAGYFGEAPALRRGGRAVWITIPARIRPRRRFRVRGALPVRRALPAVRAAVATRPPVRAVRRFR